MGNLLLGISNLHFHDSSLLADTVGFDQEYLTACQRSDQWAYLAKPVDIPD